MLSAEAVGLRAVTISSDWLLMSRFAESSLAPSDTPSDRNLLSGTVLVQRLEAYVCVVLISFSSLNDGILAAPVKG